MVIWYWAPYTFLYLSKFGLLRNIVAVCLSPNRLLTEICNLKSSNSRISANHDLQNGVDVFLQVGQPCSLLLEITLQFQNRIRDIFQCHFSKILTLLLLEGHQLLRPLHRAFLEVKGLRLLDVEVLFATVRFVNLIKNKSLF
jgi:hypothetical protein